jgi:hypothetical protein
VIVQGTASIPELSHRSRELQFFSAKEVCQIDFNKLLHWASDDSQERTVSLGEKLLYDSGGRCFNRIMITFPNPRPE